MEGVWIGQAGDTLEWIFILRANVDAAGGQAGGRFSGGDQRHFPALSGQNGARGQTRHARPNDNDIIFNDAHLFLSIARMPR